PLRGAAPPARRGGRGVHVLPLNAARPRARYRAVFRDKVLQPRGSDHMAGVVKKGFASADEVRTPDKTRMEIVDLGGVKAARLTAQPGWRWSEGIKPVAGPET